MEYCNFWVCFYDFLIEQLKIKKKKKQSFKKTSTNDPRNHHIEVGEEIAIVAWALASIPIAVSWWFLEYDYKEITEVTRVMIMAVHACMVKVGLNENLYGSNALK